MTKEGRTYNGLNTVYLINGVGKIGQINAKKKKKVDDLLIPYTRINTKWIKYLNIQLKTINLLEENIGSIISDISLSNIVFDISPPARKTKQKTNGTISY